MEEMSIIDFFNMNTEFKYNGYSYIDNDKFKSVHGSDFNLYYRKSDGYAERWGRSKSNEDDPVYSRLGPTIMDIELAKDVHPDELQKYKHELIENNTCLGRCKFCYKSNSLVKHSHYMSLAKFKQILMQCANTHVKIGGSLIFFNDEIEVDGVKMRAINYPDLNWETDICNCAPLLQLAFGITNLTTNPELLQICAFSQKIGITPNITCHGKDEVSDDFLKALCGMCGAISVSKYDKDKTYNFLERLWYNGARQTNMHVLVAEETYDDIMETLYDMRNDKRLANLKSIVMLFLKRRGRGENYHTISDEKAEKIFKTALDNDIDFGFDICCSHRFNKFIKKYFDKERNSPESYDFCDSGRFSGYVNTLGEYCPCSFIENNGIWLNGPNVLECKNFIKDIWLGDLSEMYRACLLGNDQKCLYYDV